MYSSAHLLHSLVTVFTVVMASQDTLIADLQDKSKPFMDVVGAACGNELREFLEGQSITTREVFGALYAKEKHLDEFFTITDVPVLSLLQKSNFRLSFMACKAISEASIKSATVQEETRSSALLDDPITSKDRKVLLSNFTQLYQHSPGPEDVPASTTFGRLWRESVSETNSYILLSKVRSLADEQQRPVRSKERIGRFTLSETNAADQEDSPIQGALDWLQRLTVLMYGYAIVGTRKCSNNLPWVPFDAAFQYIAKMRRALVVVGLERVASADELIRRAALKHVMNIGLSLGEALTRAFDEKELLLVRTNIIPTPPVPPRAVAQSPRTPPGLASSPRPKAKARPNPPMVHANGPRKPSKGAGKGANRSRFPTVFALSDGTRLCKSWNDSRGCAGNCGAAHQCDVSVNGQACGAPHPRHAHV